MQKILGIDLGATSVKAVAIEASFRTHAVRGFRAEPVKPPQAPVATAPQEGQPQEEQPPRSYADRARAALEAFQRDGWFEADRIICSMPGTQIAAHVLNLPFTERKQIDAVLPGEVEELIPFNLEDVLFDSHVVSKAVGRSDVLVTVAQRPQVKAVLELLQAVGVDPAVITFSALSLADLVAEGCADATHAPEGQTGPAAEAILDLGAERTGILILEDGEARFARTVATAGNQLTGAIARALAISTAEAETTKRSVDLGGQGEPALTAIVVRTLAPLIREVRSTFAAHAARTRRKVIRVRLTGGASRLGGLTAFLSEALGVPVEPLALHEKAGLPDSTDAARGALPLALALHGLGTGRTPRINFRRGDLAYSRDVGDTRSLYVGLAAMAATILVLFSISAWARVHALETREDQLNATLCETSKQILGTCETDYHTTLALLQGKGSPTAAIPQTSAVGLAQIIGQLFPQGSDTVLNDLDISDGKVMLRGGSKSYDSIDDLVAGLQSNKCFKEVKKGQLTKMADGKVDFALEATYTCGGLGEEGT